ncbi:TetR/AcrR family transcriptional regulator [Afifella marina]|nr:TetR/AcrR family transcriptional regulator [Afifella marina]
MPESVRGRQGRYAGCADQPFRPEDDRGGIGAVDVSRNLRTELDDTRGDIHVRHAPALGEAQARDPLVGEQDRDGSDGAIAYAEIPGRQIDGDAFRMSDPIGDALRLVEIAPSDQKWHVRVRVPQIPGRVLPHDTGASHQQDWVERHCHALLVLLPTIRRNAHNLLLVGYKGRRMTEKQIRPKTDGRSAAARLSKAERRHQLLDTARTIVREEGTDRLSLGHLAARAGVSKPVAYDHFGDRSGLLIALYRWIDTERMNTFRSGLVSRNPTRADAIEELAAAYIDCATDISGDFHAVGAALAGSDEKANVLQELLDQAVEMFAAVLAPHSNLPSPELERRSIGLVGAGEALSMAVLRGVRSKTEVTRTFSSMIAGCI